MLDLTALGPRKLGVFTGTALNLYILLGTITICVMALHPNQVEEMPLFNFSCNFLHTCC